MLDYRYKKKLRESSPPVITFLERPFDKCKIKHIFAKNKTDRMNKYVAYYRVSTKKQALGLEAQKAMVVNYLSEGDQIIEEYIERETGTNKRVRPQLLKAIEYSRETGAVLLIAKLDRLSRNVAFTAHLMDSGVQFKAVDMPEADNFTIHIIAAMAQREAEAISERTTASLKAIKEQIKQKGSYTSKAGNSITSLGGSYRITDKDRARSAEVLKQKALLNPNNKRASAYACVLREKGLNFSEIAKELNLAGFKTSRGKSFQSVQVQRLMKAIPC